MAKILTITQFADTCARYGYSKFVFSSVRQKERAEDGSLLFAFEFARFAYSLQPNSVLFAGANGEIILSRIKYILFRRSASQAVFSFVCGDKDSDLNDHIYNITTA